MPVRTRHNKRRSVRVTPEAVRLFAAGRDARGYALRNIKIALASTLGRSKFAASPLDALPRSLIGCDREPISEVLALRRQLLEASA